MNYQTQYYIDNMLSIQPIESILPHSNTCKELWPITHCFDFNYNQILNRNTNAKKDLV